MGVIEVALGVLECVQRREGRHAWRRPVGDRRGQAPACIVICDRARFEVQVQWMLPIVRGEAHLRILNRSVESDGERLTLRPDPRHDCCILRDAGLDGRVKGADVPWKKGRPRVTGEILSSDDSRQPIAELQRASATLHKTGLMCGAVRAALRDQWQRRREGPSSSSIGVRDTSISQNASS